MLQNKFWQAFFALAPLISLLLIFIGYGIFIFSIISQSPDFDRHAGPPMSVFGGLGALMILLFIIILISLGSLVFYIVHAAKNANLQENNLLLIWILLFVFASGIGQLIYWIIEILNKPES